MIDATGYAERAERSDAIRAALRIASTLPASPTAQPCGLVSISTSDTPKASNEGFPVFVVDAGEARVKRLRRRVCKAAELHELAMTQVDGYAPAMVTTTYANGDDWNPRHISQALKSCRQWLARRKHPMRYVWCAELQERGAIHYHIIVWFPVKKWGQGFRCVEDTPPLWDIQGWWKHGSTQSAWAHKAVGYIAKYASKATAAQKLPSGARGHGSGGFTAKERMQMAHHSRPTWVRTLSYIGQRIQRAKGGGIVQHFACGLKRRIASPFVLLMRGAGRVVVARRDAHPDLIRAFIGDLWTPQPA